MKSTEITIEKDYGYRIYLSGGIYFVDFFTGKADGFETLNGARECVYYHFN